MEVLSDKNKLEMNSESLYVGGESCIFVFLRRTGTAFLADGAHSLSAGWKRGCSHICDSSCLVQSHNGEVMGIEVLRLMWLLGSQEAQIEELIFLSEIVMT